MELICIAYFCYSVSGLFIEDSDVYKLETSYNHRIIWPIIDRLSKMIETTEFQPREVQLQAICDELKLAHKDNSSYYNADGIIINNKRKIEIAAVETTGPFHLSNNSKETQDYTKAGYGLVSMLRFIGRKFPYGNCGIFKRIDVFFIQVTRMYLLQFFNCLSIVNQSLLLSFQTSMWWITPLKPLYSSVHHKKCKYIYSPYLLSKHRFNFFFLGG